MLFLCFTSLVKYDSILLVKHILYQLIWQLDKWCAVLKALTRASTNVERYLRAIDKSRKDHLQVDSWPISSPMHQTVEFHWMFPLSQFTELMSHTFLTWFSGSLSSRVFTCFCTAEMTNHEQQFWVSLRPR